MNRHPHPSWLAALVAAGMAGCVSPPPVAPPPPSPNDACHDVMETLSAAVPLGQSQAELQARGIRVRTPLNFPPGTAPRPPQPSGAAVQLMIQPDGSVLPGSTRILKSIGEPQIASAMEAGALSMNFEFDVAAQPVQPIPFTATLAVCARS